MMAKIQRDPKREQFWRSTLQAWSISRQPIRDFCRERRLAETAFHFWRKELRRRDEEVKVADAIPRFVAVNVTPAPLPMTAVEVRCPSGHVVAISTCDQSILQSLFAVLRLEASC